ncbi:MAG TPA: hypothetical protein VNV18_10445 [Stellaceae bacterium]|nr:hypothetical protein [Stellaceae bacterium]
MVAVVETKQEAGAAQSIEFRVERHPDDPDLLVGSWRLAHNGKIIEESRPGVPIRMEFRFAVDCADQHGIPFVWVNDPDELFPPWER